MRSFMANIKTGFVRRYAALPCIVLGALGTSLAHAQAQTQDLSKWVAKANKVADNFYVVDESEAHGGSISILTGPDGTVLVDTGVAQLAARVAAEIKKLSPQPIRYVINTHSHVDETGGNEYFAKLGATIIARTQVRDTMARPTRLSNETPADGREARQVRQNIPAAAVPSVTFGNSMSLHLNGQEIRVVSVPPAHTDGDALIYFPGLDVIVAGDVLRAGEYPSINRASGGTLPGMLEALARLIALAGPQTRVVTSHGDVVDRSVVVAQRDFILKTRERMLPLIEQGKSLKEITAANITEGLGVRATPGHIGPEAYVRDMYAELTAAR